MAKDPGGTVDGINPVPLKGSIRVPLRASFKGSIGFLGFRDDIHPALPIIRKIPKFP